MARWVVKEDIDKIETGDKLQVRYMNGTARVIEDPEEDTVRVIFLSGPWKDRVLDLIHQQIEKVL
jgi:hypothetical protein